MPDAVLGEADEVVLIDLTVEALLERLRAGKIYPEERIGSALQNFFRIENLQSLRELALRQVAEDVESKRIDEEAADPPTPAPGRVISTDAPQAIGERLLALVTPRPSRSGSSAGPGARRSGSAPSSTCSGSTQSHGPPRRDGRPISSRRCGASPRCSARTSSSSTGDLIPTIKRVAAERGHDLRARRPARRSGACSAAGASRCRCG